MTAIDSTMNKSVPAIKKDSVRRSVGLESVAFATAEAGSTVVSLGAVALADKLVPEKWMQGISHKISQAVIAPHQDKIEKWLDKCSIEECKIDRTKSREERADGYAKALTVFGGAWVASMIAKNMVRDKMSSLMKVNGSRQGSSNVANISFSEKVRRHIPFVGWSAEKNMINVVDEGVHLGSLIFLNTKGSDITDSNIKTMSNALEKVGVSEKKAKEISAMAMVWEVPNAIGSMAGIGAIFGKHAYGWPRGHQHQSFTDIVKGGAKSMAVAHSKA